MKYILNRLSKYFFIFLFGVCFFQGSYGKQIINKENVLKKYGIHTNEEEYTLYFSLSPNGHEIYAVDRRKNAVLFINSATGKIFYTLPISLDSDAASRTIVSPDGSKLYIAEFEKIHVIDIHKRQENGVIKTNPGYTLSDMAITADGSILYVTDFYGIYTSAGLPVVYVIDTHSGKIISKITRYSEALFLKIGAISMALNDDESSLYLVDFIAKPSDGDPMSALSVLDTHTYVIREQVKYIFDHATYHLAANQEKIYVPVLDGNLYVLNPVTYEVTSKIKLVGKVQPVRALISKDRKKVYVVNKYSNNVSVIDIKINHEIKTIDVGNKPIIAQLSKDGSKLYVANSADYSLSVIDTAKDEVVQVINLST